MPVRSRPRASTTTSPVEPFDDIDPNGKISLSPTNVPEGDEAAAESLQLPKDFSQFLK